MTTTARHEELLTRLSTSQGVSNQPEEQLRVVHDDRPCNYSVLNNTTEKLAQGDMVGLLNNNVEVILPGWF